MSTQLIVRTQGEGEQECKFLLPVDLPLGVYHDILMAEKAWCIDRMVANHQAEQEAAEKMKQIEAIQAAEYAKEDVPQPCESC